MSYNQSFKNVSFNIESSADHPAFALISQSNSDEIKKSNLTLDDLDAKNQRHQSLSQYAAALSQQQILDYFYQIAIDYFTEDEKLLIEKKDGKGRTIMHWAAKCNQSEEIFKSLQSQGGELNIANNSYRVTPIYLAIQDQCMQSMKALIHLGADVNTAAINGGTPLHAASESNNIDAIQVLLKAGPNINQQCSQGATPLFIAAQRGHVAAVQCLTVAGADCEIAHMSGATPLLMAMQLGHVEVVKALLQAGAKTDYKLPNGWSISDFAKQLQNKDLEVLFA